MRSEEDERELVDDVVLCILDKNDKCAFGEIYFESHQEFALFTKVLMQNGISFEVASYSRINRENEELQKAIEESRDNG